MQNGGVKASGYEHSGGQPVGSSSQSCDGVVALHCGSPMGMLEARFGHALDRRVRRLMRASGLLGTLSYFVIVECGLERVLAVVEAEDAFAAFAGTASRLWGKRVRTVFSIVDNPRPGVWAAYELSEEFAE